MKNLGITVCNKVSESAFCLYKPKCGWVFTFLKGVLLEVAVKYLLPNS